MKPGVPGFPVKINKGKEGNVVKLGEVFTIEASSDCQESCRESDSWVGCGKWRGRPDVGRQDAEGVENSRDSFALGD
jgi:hypothetical protein